MKLISDVTKAWKVVEDSQKSPDQAEWIDPVIAGAVEQLMFDEKRHKEIVREILEEAHEIIDDDTFDAVNRWCELKQKYLPKEITNEADK